MQSNYQQKAQALLQAYDAADSDEEREELLALISDEDLAVLEAIVQQAQGSVLQNWVLGLPFMQQTVLLTAVRGPDGCPKYGSAKFLLRWFRRCLLLSAFDRAVIGDPINTGGGSFTGPSTAGVVEDWEQPMHEVVSNYLRDLDAIPHHFQLHLLHAAEIMGYKHPDERIRDWWDATYRRLVRDMHLVPETMEAMDERLGDSPEGWQKHADPATRE